MKATFADTFYFLALLNPRDAAHAKAVLASQRLTGRLVTTQWVLVEVGDALAAPAERPKFLALLTALDQDANVEIVTDSQFYRKGVELFRHRPDKDWPLTDCISFAVMDHFGIREALTGDSHYRQASYVPLL